MQIGIDGTNVFMLTDAPVESAGRVFAFGQIEDEVPAAMTERNWRCSENMLQSKNARQQPTCIIQAVRAETMSNAFSIYIL